MGRPAPRTLTPREQNAALAAPIPSMKRVLRELDEALKSLRPLLDLIAARKEKAATQVTTLPASGVDEIHGRTVQPSAEAGMEFLVAAWQELPDMRERLRELLGFR